MASLELLDGYLSKRLLKMKIVFDRSDITRISSRTGASPDEVRAALRRRGYALYEKNGRKLWSRSPIPSPSQIDPRACLLIAAIDEELAERHKISIGDDT